MSKTNNKKMKDENDEVTGYFVNIDKFNRFEKIYNDNPNLSIRALSSKTGLADKTCQKFKKIKLWGIQENTENPNII